MANSKIEELYLICNDTKLDIICLSESWLKKVIKNNVLKIFLTEYNIARKDRNIKRGGGLIILIKKHIKFEILNIDNCGIIEVLFIKLVNKNITVGCCYRPPNSLVSDLDIFEECLTNLILNQNELILLGDFNINLMQKTSLQNKYINIVECLNMSQIINGNTHHLDNSESQIDHILVTDTTNIIKTNKCSFSGISHHDLIYTIYNSEISKINLKKIKYRNLNNIDLINNLQISIHNAPFEQINNIPDCNDQLILFNKLFMDTINDIIPEKSITLKSNKPKWLDISIRNLQKERDFLRRKFIKNKSDIALKSYKIIRNKCATLIRDTKRNFIENKINKPNFNTKDVCRELNKLGIFKDKNAEYIFDMGNINDLNKYYQQVGNLKFFQSNDSDSYVTNLIYNTLDLFSLNIIDESSLNNYLISIKTKAVGFDNISSDLLKLTNNRTLKFLMNIINNSFKTGVFPDIWKLAYIVPIPKVSNPKNFSDLRPISILPAPSKLIEKCVHDQLSIYLNNNNLLSENQSGFRKNHSTTTLLIHITSIIYNALNNNKVVSLILLDFSKAFDSINHNILIQNLKDIGLSPLTLNWFISYLKGRKHRVISNEKISDWIKVINGVPQGSILGPILFSIYTRQIPTIFNYIDCFMFADDTQLLKSYNIEDSIKAIDEINNDLNILYQWCEKHYLKLNPKKCLHLIIGSNKNLKLLNNKGITDLKINDIIIPRCNEARNLGLIFDEHFSWEPHINFLIKSCFSSIKPLYRYKKQFNIKVKKILINNLIISKFDYCDIVYMHMSNILQKKLQKLQNICIKFIFNLKKFDHVQKYYDELKWINLSHRREFRLGCFIFKIINNKSPSYLYSLFNDTSNVHSHYTRKRFFIPSIKTNNGKNSFDYYGPHFWNLLPSEIRNITNLNEFKITYLNHLKNRE